ncbi:MAG: hypothetical protein AAGF47_00400 [Planctomycetota bacterium]
MSITRGFWYVLAAICAAVPLSAAAQVVLQLRGGGEQAVASARAVDAGLECVVDGESVLVSWHLIRAVEGPAEGDTERWLAVGEHAWRGLTRLGRGDPFAAEPELAEALQMFGDSTGVSALHTAAALLRCRVALGDLAGAVDPWLRLLAAGADVEPTLARGAGVDDATGLVPALSPVFLSVASAFGAEPISTDPDRPDTAASLAVLYRAAAEGGVPADDGVRGDGVRLVRAIVEAINGDDQARRLARLTLATIRDESGDPWMTAWCDAAIGRSLLRESPERWAAGIGHLLAVRVRHERDLPALAGHCLAEAAVFLDRRGGSERAGILARELATSFPGHPALGRPEVAEMLRTPAPPLGARSDDPAPQDGTRL